MLFTSMPRLLLATLSSATLIAGCASGPAIDTSPKHDTGVIASKYSLQARILPDSHGEETVYTRADKRRTDMTLEYDSWLARKTLGNGNDTEIQRLDKDVFWTINNKKKRYTECPITGCTNSYLEMINNSEPTDDSEYSSEDNSDYTFEGEAEGETYNPLGSASCKISPVKLKFTLTPKQTNSIVNGFPANQYLAEWIMSAKDEQGREDKHRLVMDFWLAEPTHAMRAGWEMNDRFEKNYNAALGRDDSPITRYITPELASALALFVKDIDLKEGDFKKFAQLQGYPVSTKVEWYAEANACPPEEQQPAQTVSNGIDYTDPAAALTGMAAGFFKKKASDAISAQFRPNPNEPILRYVYDVTEIAVRPMHDSAFDIPEKYKLIKN